MPRVFPGSLCSSTSLGGPQVWFPGPTTIVSFCRGDTCGGVDFGLMSGRGEVFLGEARGEVVFPGEECGDMTLRGDWTGDDGLLPSDALLDLFCIGLSVELQERTLSLLCKVSYINQITAQENGTFIHSKFSINASECVILHPQFSYIISIKLNVQTLLAHHSLQWPIPLA